MTSLSDTAAAAGTRPPTQDSFLKLFVVCGLVIGVATAIAYFSKDAAEQVKRRDAWTTEYVTQHQCVVGEMRDGEVLRYRCDSPAPTHYVSVSEINRMARIAVPSH